jgi:hypothetical protein
MTYGLDARNGSVPHSAVPVRAYRGRPGVVPIPDPARLQSRPLAAAGPMATGAAPPPVLPTPARPAPPTDLTKVSIYLDEPADAFLETVRTAARFAKPRVDATRSAVVRLALTRLAEQLHPSDLVAELQRKAATHTGPGRKRA